MSGIQSTKLMCSTEPLRGECEKVAASMKTKKPSENYQSQIRPGPELGEGEGEGRNLVSYQGACKVDAGGAGVGTVQPGWRREAEQAAGRRHGG